jgi:hypothetical protein
LNKSITIFSTEYVEESAVKNLLNRAMGRDFFSLQTNREVLLVTPRLFLPCEVTVFSPTGKMLRTFIGNGQPMVVPRSLVPSAIDIVRVSTPKSSSIKKVMLCR